MYRGNEGKYIIKNPGKYLGGNIKNNELAYKSNLELNSFIFCDTNPYVIAWGYEIIPIKYMKPQPDGNVKPSVYFPDLYIEFIDKNKEQKRVIMEIKPEKFLKKSSSKKRKTAIAENYTYMLNMVKAEAANKWCLANGIEYRFAIEKNIIKS